MGLLMTHAQAMQRILDDLAVRGWAVRRHLKVPHATSPGGQFRLWFKTRAVYFTLGYSHDMHAARTVAYDLDKRSMTVDELVAMVEARAGVA